MKYLIWYKQGIGLFLVFVLMLLIVAAGREG